MWGVMTLMWIAIAVLFLLAVGMLVYALLLKKRLSLLEAHFIEQIQSLRHEMAVYNSAAMGVGQRLINTEKKLNAMMDKQQQLTTSDTDYLPFSKAMALAEHGADARQLVEDCGLSEAEAKLVALLQGAAEYNDEGSGKESGKVASL